MAEPIVDDSYIFAANSLFSKIHSDAYLGAGLPTSAATAYGEGECWEGERVRGKY